MTEYFRIGTDIGGTFTDIVFSGSKGTILTRKVLSTPGDYSRAIQEGIQDIFKMEGIRPSAIKDVVHGTTIVTNTCIELTGSEVGLITTEGFRDVLEIARGRMPELYNMAWSKPLPLVPRHLRFEVRERIGKKGEILRELDTDQVKTVIQKLGAAGVESIAISLYNSPLNPKHEEQIEALVRSMSPQVFISRSTKIRPMLKEYERTSETVVNAYVMPVVTSYLRSLKSSLSAIEVNVPIYVMQSSGGMITAEEASNGHRSMGMDAHLTMICAGGRWCFRERGRKGNVWDSFEPHKHLKETNRLREEEHIVCLKGLCRTLFAPAWFWRMPYWRCPAMSRQRTF